DIAQGHLEEFLAAETVVLASGVVDREEPERLAVVDPHWQRIDVEEEPVALLRRARPPRGRRPLAHVRHEGRAAKRGRPPSPSLTLHPWPDVPSAMSSSCRRGPERDRRGESGGWRARFRVEQPLDGGPQQDDEAEDAEDRAERRE